MNVNADPFDMLLTMAEPLTLADKCRLVDALLTDFGTTAPVPGFLEAEDDASWWVGHTPAQVRSIFLVAIFQAMAPEKQAEMIAYLEKNRKGLSGGRVPDNASSD